MAVSGLSKSPVSFGVFELDAHSGELRKRGVRIKLQQQPLQVLAALLERPGEVVTREELRERLWRGDVYVDFERGLNKAVGKLRDALGDTAESPQFIETLPKIGYRFIAPVVPEPNSPDETGQSNAQAGSRSDSGRKWFVGSALAGLLGSAALLALLLGSNVDRVRNWMRGTNHRPVRALAVLPLNNLSGDPAQEYFADGMTDELITSLAQLGDVQVISRTSVVQYKDAKKPLPQIGRELNVDAIVEGSVARSGQHVRITAQLVDTTTDQHIWAQTYERELGDVLKLQDEAARDIAQEIHIQIRANPGGRPSRTRPVNPDAYEAYLRGRYFWQKHSEDSFRRAIEYYQQAIAVDPSYAPAYAGLGDVYQDAASFGFTPRAVAAPKAKAAVQKALALDPNLSEAHDSLAGILEMDWNWKEAEREHRRALELNPNYANAHLFYAMYLIEIPGGLDQALAETDVALRLDPLSPFTRAFCGWVYFYAGQHDRAIEQYRKALEIDPDLGMAHQGLYEAYFYSKRYDEAMREFNGDGTLGDMSPSAMAELSEAYRKGGITGFLQESLKLQKQGKVKLGPLELASLHARLGDKKEAIELLQESVNQRDPGLALLKVGPEWDNLRSEPPFHDIVRAVGLPE